jgi:S-adenosylmethionine hydrolase
VIDIPADPDRHMTASTISLTTDFGSASGYAGALKGVLLGINPAAKIVDISHDVPAQDIAHGAFVLGSAYRFFDDTIHIAVVDPGVGTSRRALLLVTPAGRFLAPDNGLLTHVVLDQAGDTAPPATDARFMAPFLTPVPEGCAAYSITRPEYWRHPVSSTFHGRDIFAPVAAHLSLGVEPEDVGERVDSMIVLNVWSTPTDGATLNGNVIFVDVFGNLVTNLRSDRIPAGPVSIEIRGERLQGITETYAEADGLMALHGSHGYLEVAERDGSAAARLQARVGDAVRVLASDALADSTEQA